MNRSRERQIIEDELPQIVKLCGITDRITKHKIKEIILGVALIGACAERDRALAIIRACGEFTNKHLTDAICSKSIMDVISEVRE